MKDPMSAATIAVAILVLVCTAVGSLFLYLRTRRVTRTRARQHFVKSASLLAKAQTAKNPAESQALAEKAIAEADRALELDPNDAAFHIVKSLGLEVVGKSGAAIKELANALSRPHSLTIPERSNTLVKKAALLSQSGQVEEALSDLQESVALTPKNPRALVLLGQTYEKDGNIEKAIESFNQAVLLDPKSPDAQRGLQRLKV